MRTQKFYKKIFKDWYDLLEPIVSTSYFEELLDTLESKYKKNVIYPNKEYVFRVFQITNPDNIKVVIINNAPYKSLANNGLALANKPEIIRIEKDLEVVKAMSSKFRIGTFFEDTFYQTLEDWVESGVLLLNSALTNGRDESFHLQLWDDFTTFVIRELSETLNNVVFIFLGDYVSKYTSLIGENHFIKKYKHPSYAHINCVPWDFNPIEINRLLMTTGHMPINW